MENRINYIVGRRIHRINRMQAAGLLSAAQADSLLDDLDVMGSPAWEAHESYRKFVTKRLTENGGMV